MEGGTNVKSLLDESGKLPAFAWPGGYPLYYLDKENNVLCPDCATTSLTYVDPDGIEWDDKPIAWGIHYEGAPLYCDQCNTLIPSAYGDPEENDAHSTHTPDDRQAHALAGCADCQYDCEAAGIAWH